MALDFVQRLNQLVGERTYTDELLRITHFPLRGTLQVDQFDLTLVGTSGWGFHLPRLVGRIEPTAQGITIYASVAYDVHTNLFMLLWTAILGALSAFFVAAWITGVGSFHVHPLSALAWSLGLLAYGVFLFFTGLREGAQRAESLLQSLTEPKTERSA